MFHAETVSASDNLAKAINQAPGEYFTPLNVQRLISCYHVKYHFMTLSRRQFYDQRNLLIDWIHNDFTDIDLDVWIIPVLSDVEAKTM